MERHSVGNVCIANVHVSRRAAQGGLEVLALPHGNGTKQGTGRYKPFAWLCLQNDAQTVVPTVAWLGASTFVLAACVLSSEH